MLRKLLPVIRFSIRYRLLPHKLSSKLVDALTAGFAADTARLQAKCRSILDERNRHFLAMHGALALIWAALEDELDQINELAFLNGGKGDIVVAP